MACPQWGPAPAPAPGVMLTLAKVSPLLLPLLLAPHIAAENSTEGEYSTMQYSTVQDRGWPALVFGGSGDKSAYAVRSQETQREKSKGK